LLQANRKFATTADNSNLPPDKHEAQSTETRFVYTPVQAHRKQSLELRGFLGRHAVVTHQFH